MAAMPRATPWRSMLYRTPPRLRARAILVNRAARILAYQATAAVRGRRRAYSIHHRHDV